MSGYLSVSCVTQMAVLATGNVMRWLSRPAGTSCSHIGYFQLVLLLHSLRGGTCRVFVLFCFVCYLEACGTSSTWKAGVGAAQKGSSGVPSRQSGGLVRWVTHGSAAAAITQEVHAWGCPLMRWARAVTEWPALLCVLAGAAHGDPRCCAG